MEAWKRGAKQKPIPASATQRATPSGPRSITTPRASSRSADPHDDEAARLPCLQTLAPAPATTRAEMVETLIEWLRSPPVPTMSTTPSTDGSGTRSDAAEHGVEQPAHLAGGLPLHAQGHDEPGDLGRGRLAGQHLGHGRPGLGGGEVAPLGQGTEHLGPAAQLGQGGGGVRGRGGVGHGRRT